MKIGNYEIPDIRLSEALQDIKKIFDKVKNTQDLTHYTDLAVMLDYKSKIGGAFYRRLNSLTLFGLLEGRAKYRVTELGENISYPVNDMQKNELSSKAFLTVPLWNKLYNKHGKQLSENVWFDVKNITGISAPEAQAIEKDIRKWYLDDVVFMVEKPNNNKIDDQVNLPASDENNSKISIGDFVSNTSNPEQTKFINHGPLPIDQTVLERIPFGKDIIIYLPRGNIIKAWDKAQKYMKLYLEDYEETDNSTKKDEPTILNYEHDKEILQS